MNTINSGHITEEFLQRHNIAPTKQERNLIQLAILEGAYNQMKIDIINLKKKLNGK